MVKDILDRLEPRPAKRTLQDDLSLLQSLGLVERISIRLISVMATSSVACATRSVTRA